MSYESLENECDLNNSYFNLEGITKISQILAKYFNRVINNDDLVHFANPLNPEDKAYSLKLTHDDLLRNDKNSIVYRLTLRNAILKFRLKTLPCGRSSCANCGACKE